MRWRHGIALPLALAIALCLPSPGYSAQIKRQNCSRALAQEGIRRHQSFLVSLGLHTSVIVILMLSGQYVARDSGQLFSLEGTDAVESNVVIEMEFPGEAPKAESPARVFSDPTRADLEALAQQSEALRTASETYSAQAAQSVTVPQEPFEVEHSGASETSPGASGPVSAAASASPSEASGPTGGSVASAGGGSGLGTGESFAANAGEGIMNLVEGMASTASGASAIDVVFVIDGTTSMQPHIDSVKQKTDQALRRLAEVAQRGVRVRVALVEFVDVVDRNPPAWVVQNFTEDYSQFAGALNGLRIVDGPNADKAEDWLDALVLAKDSLNWDPTAWGRIIIVTDADAKPFTSIGPTLNHDQVMEALTQHRPSIKVMPLRIE